MASLHRIDDLETAVLHLTRAVNSLLAAVQALKTENDLLRAEPPARGLGALEKAEGASGRGIAGHRTSDDLIREANRYLREAFEVVDG